jgi:hypothetical protein
VLFVQGVPIAEAWPPEDKRLLLKLLNRESGSQIQAIRRWGRVPISKELLPIGRGIDLLPEISPVESARAHLFVGEQRKSFSDKKSIRKQWELFRENRASATSTVGAILKLVDEMENEKPGRWRQLILSDLWRCLNCRHFFLGKTKRQHVYCSRKCASKTTAAAAMKSRRSADHAIKLRKVRFAVKRWKTRTDWKERSAKSAGVTANWITYAIHRGYLKSPQTRCPKKED